MSRAHPPSSVPVPVSVLMPVKNEALNLKLALDTVRWSDDIWVVDSNSSDETAAIARDQGVHVVQFDYDGRWPKKKNWSLQTLEFKHEWVLILDADERVPTRLAAEIATAVESGHADGYYIDRDYVFMGRSLSSFRPNWNLRLFKHALGRYEDLGMEAVFTGDNEVHEHVILNGRTGHLKHPLLHEDKRPIRSWVDNHNRYSEWEVEAYERFLREPLGLRQLLSPEPVWRRRVLERIWVRLPARPLARFTLFYVWRRGFLDGRQGFRYAVLMAYYEYLISLKLKERQR